MARQRIRQESQEVDSTVGLNNLIKREISQISSSEIPDEQLPNTSERVQNVIEFDSEGKRLIDWTGLVNEPAKPRPKIDS